MWNKKMVTQTLAQLHAISKSQLLSTSNYVPGSELKSTCTKMSLKCSPSKINVEDRYYHATCNATSVFQVNTTYTTGTLNITGDGTPETYSSILQHLTYFNKWGTQWNYLCRYTMQMLCVHANWTLSWYNYKALIIASYIHGICTTINKA